MIVGVGIDVVDVARFQATLERTEVFDVEIFLIGAAVHLERPHGRHDHRGLGLQAAHSTLDVEELLGTEI